MAVSPIEWTDATWNPVGGCSIKSPGCSPCYAQRLAGTRLVKHPMYAGTTTPNKDGKPVFNGKLTVAADHHAVWTWPMSWRGARDPKLGPGNPSLIFVGDMSDLFHENRPIGDIDRVIIAGARSNHILQLLTKRAEVMADYILSFDFGRAVENCKIIETGWSAIGRHTMQELRVMFGQDRGLTAPPWPSPRMWLGFSAERQREFDERWPHMRKLAQRGWTIFCSHEPAIGPIDYPDDFLALGDRAQVIAGGMSGDDASPSHPDWFRHDRDQCRRAGVRFLFKQWGEFHPAAEHDHRETGCTLTPTAIHTSGRIEYRPFEAGQLIFDRQSGYAGMCCIGKTRAGRLLDGRLHDEFPSFQHRRSGELF